MTESMKNGVEMPSIFTMPVMLCVASMLRSRTSGAGNWRAEKMLLPVVVAISVYKSRIVFGASVVAMDWLIASIIAMEVTPGIFSFSSTNIGADTLGARVTGFILVRYWS